MKSRSPHNREFRAIDFFSGSGLVTEGLKPYFKTVWANDVCPKKCAVYAANFGAEHLVEKSIADISGADVPSADLAWGSFPCQDLSLAGNMKGLSKGSRSALYWEWVRILDEMGERRPPILCIENVVGFLVADQGAQFRSAYKALRKWGYRAGAIVIDAANFVPQSRQRSFLIAVPEAWPIAELGVTAKGPSEQYHPKSVMTAWKAAQDPEWIWWRLPIMPARKSNLVEFIDFDAPIDPPHLTKRLLGMLSVLNKSKLRAALESKALLVGTGYKRIRLENGQKRQRLEIRFDGIAGCLRTPEGGSSRQVLLIVKDGNVSTRLLTIRETARLMGARDSFAVPGSYNEGYKAMGDAVVVPVTRWLARHLLEKLSYVPRQKIVQSSRAG